MEKIYKYDGYTLHVIPTKKFKNITISCKLLTTLTRETATIRTLLSFMLAAGTKKYPSSKLLSQHLEDMYGARFSSTIGSKGMGHVIHVNSVCVNERFLPTDEDLFTKQVELLNEVLNEPNIVNGIFDDVTLAIKKKELKERIRANKDDKFTYSFNQLLEYMGKDQKLGISTIGYIDEIDAITNQQLVDYFNRCIMHDQKHIYVVGDVDQDYIDVLTSRLSLCKVDTVHKTVSVFKKVRDDVQEVIEKQDITQAKLNMGYRIDCDYLSKKHYAFTVFNGLFGGFSQSRLFKVVRETHSLCYYVSSNYDAFNSVMMVCAGIENSDYQKARSLIEEELKQIQEGNFEENDIEVAKKMLKNALTKANDEAGSMIALSYNRDITGKVETNKEYLDKLLQVTKQDIIECSKSIVLDTVFLLTGGSE